jgi:hypothetical protein
MGQGIPLTTTTDQIAVVTSAAGAVDASAFWMTITPSTGVLTASRQYTAQITTATTTVIVPNPASSTLVDVHSVFIRNASTTLSNQVTVQASGNSGTNYSTIAQQWLAPGDAYHYTAGRGWEYIPATTTIQVPGRLLKTTTVTTGTSFTTGTSTNSIRIRLVGGGGGGAGCTSVASAASAGGGGGGGSYAEKLFAAAPSTAYTIAIGAAGTANSGAAGGNGGNTTFAVGSVTVTAYGGTGGPVATAVSTVSAYPGGAGGIVSLNGDLNGAGDPGEPGVCFVVGTPTVISGNGGCSVWGQGGLSLSAVGAGNAGTGYGAGGGGAATGASTARAGGAGTAGAIIVDEYA